MSDGLRTGDLGLRSWTDPAVVALALMAFASGFGQGGAVAALGDVAKHFGHVVHGTTIADQAGLSGTVLGVGLAVLRLASLGGLPLAGLADRFGRRSDAAGHVRHRAWPSRCWPRPAPATGGSWSSSPWAAPI